MTCGPLVLILSDRELELEWKIPRKEGKQTNKQTNKLVPKENAWDTDENKTQGVRRLHVIKRGYRLSPSKKYKNNLTESQRVSRCHTLKSILLYSTDSDLYGANGKEKGQRTRVTQMILGMSFRVYCTKNKSAPKIVNN